MPVAGQKKDAAAASFSGMVQKAANAEPAQDTAKDSSTADSGTTSHHSGFLDFLVGLFDVINPLEHLPIISTIYESVTGHHMNPMARIAGDTLYGGPIGTAVGIVNVVSEEKTGKDIGQNVMAMVTGSGKKDDTATTVAQNDAPKASDIVWNDAPPVAVASAAAPADASPDDNVRLALLALAKQQNSTQQDSSTPASTSSQRPGLWETGAAKEVSSRPDAGNGLSLAQGAPEGAVASAQTGKTPVSPPQDAPADAPERAIPPELIAQKMMSGLDKYAALKREQLPPAYSANF
jgi:hypothetical protein